MTTIMAKDKRIKFIHLPIIVLTVISFSISEVSAQCDFPLDAQPRNFPLFWKALGSGVYPLQTSNGDWVIRLEIGSSMSIGCSPSTNSLENFGMQEILVICLSDSVLITSTGETISSDLTNFGCTGPVKEQIVATNSGNCASGLQNIEIRYETRSAILPLINLCYNSTSDITITAFNTVHGKSLNPFEESNRRPSFKPGQFYPQFSVATAYMQSVQLQTMTTLVGSSELAAQYINVSKSFYLARGHLAPDGDFVHIYEQNATYYFVNVVPQWQAINNGNWKALESAVRDYAQERKIDLKIWTGASGILELNDINGNPVQIFLAKSKFLPVPKLSIKVIFDEVRNAGVAVIMLNNPHATTIVPTDIICPDVCNSITWVTWNKSNFRRGYTYCCEVKELRKTFPYIPDLGNISLLT